MQTMKPTHKLLFVLCPMLVLGFIYYSSGKLHLHVWGQKSHSKGNDKREEVPNYGSAALKPN